VRLSAAFECFFSTFFSWPVLVTSSSTSQSINAMVSPMAASTLCARAWKSCDGVSRDLDQERLAQLTYRFMRPSAS
jgi:hypothetical protein